MYTIKNIPGLCTLIFLVCLSSCTKTDTPTNATSGNWVSRSDFEGVPRSEAVSFVIGDTAYIGTGNDGTSLLNDLWQYDPLQDSWRQKADLPGAARSSAVAFAAGGAGYICTGYDGVNKLKDLWQYSPATNTWVQKADFGGSARYDAVGFGILTQGYVSTGYDGSYLKDLWQYDPGTDTWIQQISMGGSKRTGAVVFVYQNKAYVCTGSDNGSSTNVNDLWVFDPAIANENVNGWTEKRKISNVSADSYDDAYNIIRTNAAAFVIGNKAYVTCGENGAVLNTTWEYDFSQDLWVAKTAYEGVARTGSVGFTVLNRGYVTTGRSSTLSFDDIREFHPNEVYNPND